MRTYIFQEIDSLVRGFDTHITVHRMIRNRPQYVGSANHNTASWRGAHGEAVNIIHDNDGLPFATDVNGCVNRYRLRFELGPCDKYTDTGHARRAVRLFEI